MHANFESFKWQVAKAQMRNSPGLSKLKNQPSDVSWQYFRNVFINYKPEVNYIAIAEFSLIRLYFFF